MTAPSHQTRGTPAGIKMDDGFSTKIAFARDTTICFWEKTVKPPGYDGGDAIDTTTMHNVTYRTFAPRSLKTLTEMQTVVAWDPLVYTRILSNLINQEGAITVRFPDGSRLTFYGYLRTFEPSDMAEGEQPEATIMIQPTNQDPTTGSEEAAVLSEVAGT